MSPSRARRGRRGAALVEAAIIMTLFLTVIFGMLDMGLAVFRNHVVSEAARQGARIASVHGNLAPSNNTTGMNAWGPLPTTAYYQAPASQSLYTSSGYVSGSAAYTVQADNSSDELAKAIKPYLPGVDPSKVTIGIYWQDGSNDLGNRVTVSISTSYSHFIYFVFKGTSVQLNASSTMTITH